VVAGEPGLDVQGAYREHAAFVERSLRRLGVPLADLEDLTQEVFLVAHRRRDSYERGARLTSWLFGIALRVAKRHRRRPWFQREQPLASDDASEPQSTHTPERALEHNERQHLLAGALATLRPERSAVFVMSELEGIALREIAEQMSTPLGTACSRLHAARKDLARALATALALTLLFMIARVAPGSEAAGFADTRVRPEPGATGALAPFAATRAANAGETSEGEQARAVPADRQEPRSARPPRAMSAPVLPRSARPAQHAKRAVPAAEPAWLSEARAALALDPARTLALIRSHHDAAVPVSPEVVELTIRALQAQHAQTAERAGAVR
jgi:RNA polymerase sigma-70 factor (ECF subfamily)